MHTCLVHTSSPAEDWETMEVKRACTHSAVMHIINAAFLVLHIFVEVNHQPISSWNKNTARGQSLHAALGCKRSTQDFSASRKAKPDLDKGAALYKRIWYRTVVTGVC